MTRMIAPSILSADFLNLGESIEMLNRSQADWIHVDVMDGIFVPNISFGFPVLDAVSRIAKKPLDVHLMIEHADIYIDRFVKSGASFLSVHYEACRHLNRTLNHIRDCGAKAGIVLNPHTPVALLENSIAEADFVLLMSVNPGYGGQKFIQSTLEKIGSLKALIALKNPACLIEVDGGVNRKNASLLFNAGADVLVAGNSVFGDEDPEAAIIAIKNA